MNYVKSALQVIKTRLGQDLFNTLLLTSALFVSSFLSYLLQFFLGRALPITEFGDFTALLTLVAIMTFFGTIVGYSLVKVFADLNVANQSGKIKWLFYEVVRYSSLIGLLLGIVCVIFYHQIGEAFQIANDHTVILFGFYLMVSFVPIFIGVFFQGLYKITWLSTFLVGSGLLRLLTPAVLVLVFQPTATFVYMGLFISQILTILMGLLIARYSCLSDKDRAADKSITTHLFKDSFFNGFALLTLMVMISVDIIFVKHFFSPYIAGIYAGVVTMGKIVIFGAGAVATVMFPRAVAVRHSSANLKRTITKFSLIQIIFVLIVVLMFVTFPGIFTHLFFGSRYDDSIKYVPLYSIFVGVYVLANFAVLTLIAIGERKFALIMPIFLLLQFIGFYFFSADIYHILVVNFFAMLLLLTFMVFNVVKIIWIRK